MPLLTYTGTSEAEEMIRTELLGDAVDGYEFGPRVALIVAGVAPGKGNIPKRFARWNQLSIPGGAIGIAETVDSPDANVDMTESSVTPARIRFRMAISDELFAEAESPAVPAGAVAMGLEALADQLNTDVHASSTAATQTEGDFTDTYDLTEFRSTRQTYRAMELGRYGVPALVLHDDPLNDLETSIDTSASLYSFKSTDTLSRELGDSYQGRLRGFEVFRDPAIATDSGGHSNYATPMGMQGGLVCVANSMPKVTPSDGDEAKLRGVKLFFFELWKGQGIRNPRRILEVRSR